MTTLAIQVANADRMMTYARATEAGLEVSFADGATGVIPFADIPEIGALSNLVDVSLPNLYEVVLRNQQDEEAEIPWDFARHYCDARYRPRVEAIALEGQKAIGRRIRELREASRKTQEVLAGKAGISRVTLVRIENGDQSPRYETLVALAAALGRPLDALLMSNELV